MSIIRTISIAFLCVMGLAACTPEQVAVFNTLSPEQQEAVVEGMSSRPSADCIGAMKKVWPPSTHSWAARIIERESGNNPSAANPSSSARGCFQMLALHNHRYASVGCSSSQWSNADCNVKAAYTLYQEAGTSPWNV